MHVNDMKMFVVLDVGEFILILEYTFWKPA